MMFFPGDGANVSMLDDHMVKVEIDGCEARVYSKGHTDDLPKELKSICDTMIHASMHGEIVYRDFTWKMRWNGYQAEVREIAGDYTGEWTETGWEYPCFIKGVPHMFVAAEWYKKNRPLKPNEVRSAVDGTVYELRWNDGVREVCYTQDSWSPVVLQGQHEIKCPIARAQADAWFEENDPANGVCSEFTQQKSGCSNQGNEQ